MPAAITKVVSCFAKALDVLTITGTGFVDDPSLTKVWMRETGETVWEVVDPTRVAFVSDTEITVTIDAANTDTWNNGLNDIGVAAFAETAPESELLGCLYFYVAGTFAPDDVIKGALEELYIKGLFMGHTHGDLDIEHEVEQSDIEVDQELLPVRTVKVGESFSMSVPLAEVTLEHIKEVWGISAEVEEVATGVRRLTFGGDATVVEKEVLVIVPAGSGKRWAMTFYRCAITSPGTLTWSKDDQVDLGLQITVLADTSRAVGDRVGRFEEYAAA